MQQPKQKSESLWIERAINKSTGPFYCFKNYEHGLICLPRLALEEINGKVKDRRSITILILNIAQLRFDWFESEFWTGTRSTTSASELIIALHVKYDTEKTDCLVGGQIGDFSIKRSCPIVVEVFRWQKLHYLRQIFQPLIEREQKSLD